MMEIGGKPAAGIGPQPQQQRDAGVPPLWNSYVTVDSADAAADRPRSLAPPCTRRPSTSWTSAAWP